MRVKIKEKVARYLYDLPILREKKVYVQCAIWKEQSDKLGIVTIDDFLQAYQEGKIANAESIRRVACKLMEEFPELKPKKETQEKNEELNQIIKQNKGEL